MPLSLPRAEPSYGVERFRRLLSEPEAHQLRVLRAILRRNADCDFGRRHGFADIETFERYRARVPVARYEDLRAPIERMARGEAGVLTSEPVCAWEETGGSSGGAKLVAYTAAGLREFRAGLAPWLDSLHAACPRCACGRSYWAISPAGRSAKRTPSGMPVGLPDTAYFGESRSAELAATLAVPAQVGGIRDLGAWRHVTALHLVACPDLTLVSVWSPTFLLELLAYIEREAQALAA
ncbi:MAG: GH3 auxin-responsive promoter, partial [Betaproteobacteria bacterium]